MSKGLFYIETNKTPVGSGYIFCVPVETPVTFEEVQRLVDEKKPGELIKNSAVQLSIDGKSYKILK